MGPDFIIPSIYGYKPLPVP